MNFVVEQGKNAMNLEGTISKNDVHYCSEDEMKMMGMRETRIGLFIQMELEACRGECQGLLRCHHCIIGSCPEEYCPPMPVSIRSDYTKNLIRRWEITRKGVLSPTLKIIFKKYYPLPAR